MTRAAAMLRSLDAVVLESRSMLQALVNLHASLDELIAVGGSAVSGTAGDVFASEAWFRNLLMHGFDAPIQALWLSLTEPAKTKPAMAIGLKRSGREWGSLSNYYSCLWDALGDPAAVQAASWNALGLQLRHLPAPVLRLQPLAADGALLAGMEQGLRAAGYWTDRFFCFGNWYLPVRGRTGEEHFFDRPSALRNSVERGRRRLDRSGPWELRIHRDPDPSLDRAVADFDAVYNKSWKVSEPCADFMPGLIRTAAAQGWLRLGVLRLAGEPIAAQVWLVHGGKANIYKLAYVTGHERLSPGSVLTAALMAHVIDVDGVHEIDYLSGDDAYKRDWMTARRERVGLLAFQPSHWSGLVAASRHFTARWLQRVRHADRRNG